MKPLLVLIACLPNIVKIRIYNSFFNANIHPSAKIGLSYIHADKIVMGPHTKVGHFNIVKNLSLFQLSEYASIGHLNEFMAISQKSKKHFRDELNRFSALKLGCHSSIVKGHFFDCNNTVTIGDFSLVAGTGSTFFTHGIDFIENRQRSAPVSIGNYCIVSAKCVIVKGSILPNYSVLAANSTLHKAFTSDYTLYSGVPAKAIKPLPTDAKFFTRQSGYVE